MGFYRCRPNGNKTVLTANAGGYYRCWKTMYKPASYLKAFRVTVSSNTYFSVNVTNFKITKNHANPMGINLNYNGDKTTLSKSGTNVFVNSNTTGTIYLNSNCSNMFYNCKNMYNFNFMQDFDTSLVINGSYMFYNCTNFNEPISFSNAENLSHAFDACTRLKSDISIDGNNVDCSYAFKGCVILNKNVQFNNVSNGVGMFSICRNLNQNIAIPNGITDCTEMFCQCDSLDQNIAIPNGVTNCHRMFLNCFYLRNQNIIIPNTVTDCSEMFVNCTNLISVIQVPNNAENCAEMFSFCLIRGKIGNIPNKVTNCYRMYASANFDASVRQSFSIGENAYNLSNMFSSAKGFTGTIYCKGTNVNVFGMFRDKNNSLRVNLFCVDDTKYRGTGSTGDTAITGGAISWTRNASNDCRYNTAYNIYIYNNWSGTT